MHSPPPYLPIDANQEWDLAESTFPYPAVNLPFLHLRYINDTLPQFASAISAPQHPVNLGSPDYTVEHQAAHHMTTPPYTHPGQDQEREAGILISDEVPDSLDFRSGQFPQVRAPPCCFFGMTDTW